MAFTSLAQSELLQQQLAQLPKLVAQHAQEAKLALSKLRSLQLTVVRLVTSAG